MHYKMRDPQHLDYAQSFLLDEFVDAFHGQLPLALRARPPSRAMLSRVLNTLDERRIERYRIFKSDPTVFFAQIPALTHVAKPLTVAILLRCGISKPTILDHCMQIFDVHHCMQIFDVHTPSDDDSEVHLD